jgi:mRNA guanylyltransferase
MFKWKPRDSNTIDFLFTRRSSSKWGMYVQEKGKYIFESELSNELALDGTVEGSIVECQYMHDDSPRWWKPMNIRTDKTHPNNRRTFYRTLTNISENIQLNEFKKM